MGGAMPGASRRVDFMGPDKGEGSRFQPPALRATSAPEFRPITSLAAERPIRSRTAGVPFAEAIFGFVAKSHARACALLVLLSLACFLPGFVSLQPMDRDEPRYAQASKQMLESGDFVDIRF